MKIAALTFMLSLVLLQSSAQILITDKGDTASHPSTVLEARSSTKGFLPPAMRRAQRKNMANPANGLIVYDTDQESLFVYTTKSGWRPLMMGEEENFGYNDSIVPADLQPEDCFGYSLALDGDYLLVGAPLVDVPGKMDQGAAYLFKRTPTGWNQISKFFAPDGQAYDEFGTKVCMKNGRIVISSPKDNYPDSLDVGSAYYFLRENDAVVYQSKIRSNDGAGGDQFGLAMHLQNDMLFVGAPYDDVASNSNQGSVYCFKLVNNTWTQYQQIIRSNGAAEDFFGGAFAMRNDSLVVGNSYWQSGFYGHNQNVAILFKKNGEQWQFKQNLARPIGVGTPSDAYATAVAFAGRHLWIGAFFWKYPDGNNFHRGSVAIFQNLTTNFGYDQVFAPADVNTVEYSDYFGYCIKSFGKYVAVGSPLEDYTYDIVDKGAVYIYSTDQLSPTLIKKINPRNLQETESFGWELEMDGNFLIIGAPGADDSAGRVYIYDLK